MNKKQPVRYFTWSLKYAGLAFLLSFLLSPIQYASAAGEAQPKMDLRVIIDISGSMKKSDPTNLRRPALRLLAGMIPSGSHAGVWNFGKQVNMIVRVGEVNEAWREQARKQSDEISSVGLFTNIESAMRKASFDWSKPDPDYKRNLILLTDGHVDVAKNQDENKASKSRIIHEILPALEKAKVKIHTIALSDDVDDSLLSTLSAYTNGLYKKVSNAEELQKVFLQMLEQSANLDSLPLSNDNTFKVDKSIEDMTLLVFNQDKSHPTEIITPAQQTWTEKKNASQVKWFSDKGYDLLTVKKPGQGEWKIVAPLDKNNRVIVATNLKLKVNELPGYIMPGDMINLTAELLEDGKPLKDQRLLSKFTFTAERKAEGHQSTLYQMSSPGNDDNKSYFTLPSVNDEGINELIIKAKSPTAEREVHHQFRVYSTVANVNISDEHGKYRLEVKPYDNLLKPESVKINAVLEDKSEHTLSRKGDVWIVDIDPKYHGSMVELNLQAVRSDTKPLIMQFSKKLEASAATGALKVEEKAPVVDLKQEKEEHVKTEKNIKEQGKEAEHNKAAKASSAKVDTEVNWTLIIISMVVGNLLIFGMLVGGYYFIKRRKEKMSASLKEEMSEGGKE